MSQFDNFVDQENLHARPAPGKGHVAPTRGTRAVLGEISQNVTARRQPLRASKQPEKSAFSIFCDENAGVSKPKPVVAKSAIPSALVDKENVPVVPRVPALGSLKTVHKFSDSDSSDMEMDSSPESEPEAVKSEWRVPPLGQHQPEAVDIFSAPEYSEDIYNYLRQSEVKHMAKHNYMGKQSDISHSMRSILVDWLVEVGEEYKLQTETLYLAVSYIDRFLSYMSVQRSKLQLVGTAAMFIASKYEEIYPPDVGEFVYITDDTYNKRQVLRMEHLVLKVLGFDLSGPTANVFLSQMCQLSKSEEKIQHLAMYVCELSLLHGDTFLKFPPSEVAAASLVLARHALSRECDVSVTWPESLVTLTGYTCDTLRECIMALQRTWRAAEDSPQQAIREKYKSSKYRFVSDLPVPALH
jgi:cyclin A